MSLAIIISDYFRWQIVLREMYDEILRNIA